MKQHAAASLFPAAAVTVVLFWLIGEMWKPPPNEVAIATTAVLSWVASKVGLSRDQPPVDSVTGEQVVDERRPQATGSAR